jgi:hypothetical protein
MDTYTKIGGMRAVGVGEDGGGDGWWRCGVGARVGEVGGAMCRPGAEIGLVAFFFFVFFFFSTSCGQQ